jgi:hypothetical protein
MTVGTYDFVMWCVLGIAVCVLLQQIDLFIRDMKAERLEAWKQAPLETVESVPASPESDSEPL